MNYKQYQLEDARLVILIMLEGQDIRAMNEHVLKTGLLRMAHAMTADQIRTELSWLKDQGLVRVEVVDGVHVATILRRGEEVAKGITTIPGVKRPNASEA